MPQLSLIWYMSIAGVPGMGFATWRIQSCRPVSASKANTSFAIVATNSTLCTSPSGMVRPETISGWPSVPRAS